MQISKIKIESFNKHHGLHPRTHKYPKETSFAVDVDRDHRWAKHKGSLISESFSLRLKSQKKQVPNHSPEHILSMWIEFILEIWAKMKNFWD